MKKIITALFIFTIILPFTANAHTTLTESYPSEGEVIPEVLKEVQLDFGTDIEEASTMALEGESASYEFESIAVEGHSMTGTINEELPNGAYIVQWKIIGADGHPIEGGLPFALNIETADEEEPKEEPVSEQMTFEEPAASETSAEAESDGGSTLGLILLIAAAILLVFGLYKMLTKKR